MKERKSYIKEVRRVVVKVGSSTLTHSNGLLNFRRIESLVKQLSDLHNSGLEVVLVSSGAIAAGVGKLGLTTKPKLMPQKQAAAAVGQVALMHMYDKFFAEYGQIAAQVLITKEDMNHETRVENAKNTFSALLAQKVIPIVNENDAIATEEIKFGDNDTLSAEVCSLIHADLLILLSDIDGLYDCNPLEHPDAHMISYVEEVTEDIMSAASGSGSSLGTGGMITKLKAAKIATASGAAMIIVDGSIQDILNKVIEGEDIGTYFPAIEN
jgi:glutamate 5-kinase